VLLLLLETLAHRQRLALPRTLLLLRRLWDLAFHLVEGLYSSLWLKETILLERTLICAKAILLGQWRISTEVTVLRR